MPVRAAVRPHFATVAACSRRLAPAVLLLLAGAAAGDGGLLAARQTPLALPLPDLSLSFLDALDVRLVGVDVRLTDGRGRPLGGLRREDFVLLEDGHPVEISHFEAPTGAPATSPGAAGGAAPGGEPPLVVLYADLQALAPTGRARAVAELRRLLAEPLASRYRWLVAARDQGPRLLAGPTADLPRVRAAVDALAQAPAWGHWRGADWQALFEDLAQVARDCGESCGECFSQVLAAADLYALSVQQRAEEAAGGLADLIAALGSLPGRKALIYLADGLEQRPGLDAFEFLGEVCRAQEAETWSRIYEFDLTARLERVAALANAAEVTLYGLSAAVPAGSPPPAVSGRLRPSPRTERLRGLNQRGGLAVLAAATGGRPLEPAGRRQGGLAGVGDDLAGTYRLAFSPAHPADGRAHSLTVRMAGGRAAGLELRYRRSYQDPSPDEMLAQRALATLLLGTEDNPLGVAARWEFDPAATAGLAADPAGALGARRLPLRVEIPLAALTFRPGGGAAQASVRMLLVIQDGRGRRTAIRERRIAVPAPGAGAAPGEPHSVAVMLDLSPGEHQVVVAVVDEGSGVGSFLRRRVAVT